MTRTIKQLAQEAIQIQDACNPLGLSKGYAAALTDLRDALAAGGLPCGTLEISRHPVNQLWASKLHDLAGMGWSQEDTYGRAYDACKWMSLVPDEVAAMTPATTPVPRGWDHL